MISLISFIESSKNVIQNNVYYLIVDGGLSKFGNDSATGSKMGKTPRSCSGFK